MLAVETARELLEFRFRPGKDLIALLVTWGLVTGSLSLATFVIGAENGGWYFLAYAVLGAAVCGVALPLIWTVGVRKAPVADLGITTKRLGACLALQAVFAVLQYSLTLAKAALPAWDRLLPLIGLALAIGLFEAIFWRGWLFSRLEEMFGFLPALVFGAGLYALYHIGYGMPWGQIGFLFWIGVLYAVAFRLTRSIFILWPVFQPVGQLFTLVNDGLDLPLIAAVGFAEVAILMWVLVFFAHRYWKRSVAPAARFSAEQVVTGAE